MKTHQGLWMAAGLAMLASTAPAQLPSSLTISGTPLRITVTAPEGGIWVGRLQGSDYIRQYYWEMHSFLFLDGVRYTTGLSGNGWFAPETTVTPFDFRMPDPWTIVNVVNVGSTGVRITQTLSYVNGQQYFTKTWRVENLGSQTFNEVRFLHGGDTFFAGDDDSQGHWDPLLQMVYLTNPNPALTGIMGFYAALSSPSDHYYENYYGTCWDLLETGNLPDTVRPDYHDAAYALQWNRTSLAPGQTWLISAYEKWTDAGVVQVIASGDQTAAPGSTAVVPFTLVNYQPILDTFDLHAMAGGGWPASLAARSVVLPGSASTSINVTVEVPAGALPGDSSVVTLMAISQTDTNVANQDAATIRIPGTNPVPVKVFQNVTPSLTMSYTGWTLNRTTGTLLGTLKVVNRGNDLLTAPFWYAVPYSPLCHLWRPSGALANGTPYLDITAAVHAALRGVGNRDLTLNPGESILVPNIEFYSYNRVPPVGNAYAMWADPPRFDSNMDGAIGDGEILTAVDEWKAGTADDAALFQAIRLWKQGGGE